MEPEGTIHGKIPFEEALEKTGYGLYNYLLTALAGVSSTTYVALLYGTTIIVPTSACELETTSAQQGLLVALPVAGATVGALLWGYLGDTRGRRSMLLVSQLLAALSNALASLSVNWIMLLIVQLITGILGSGIYALSVTLLSESVPLSAILSQVVDKAGRRNMAMALTGVCGVAGVLVNLVPNAIASAALFMVFSIGVIVLGFYAAIAVALFPTHLRTMAMAITMMGGNLMGVVFIQIMNYMLENSCQLGFYLFCSLFTASVLVLALLATTG